MGVAQFMPSLKKMIPVCSDSTQGLPNVASLTEQFTFVVVGTHGVLYKFNISPSNCRSQQEWHGTC